MHTIEVRAKARTRHGARALFPEAFPQVAAKTRLSRGPAAMLHFTGKPTR